MKTLSDLAETLRGLDGRGYKAYRDIKGAWQGDGFVLRVDYVQGDPYARPSQLRVDLSAESAAFPDWAAGTRARRVATADYLNRRFHAALAGASGSPGSGRSGQLRILRPGQQILERAALELGGDGAVVARFRAGLPARGRRVLGRAAAALLCDAVPSAVREALPFEAQDASALRRHVETVEDARSLRSQLTEQGLVGFVADGSVLPRRSGVDDRRLEEDAVPFTSPEQLRVTLDAPHAGPVTGMGVPEGVTLIVGGGYHGKSTLLRALERGVYDHVPGDGRERVVAVETAVKVRAEDGRSIPGTDISNFIGGLPAGEDTRRFRTENASGSTSQAAAIVEALEAGATALLLDEDTSATNFMIRDGRMQRLVRSADEPITPFIDRARQLVEELGVSTVLVVGGSGDYFDVADTVIAMRAYRPHAVVEEARAVAQRMPSERQQEGGPWRALARRRPDPDSIDPSRGKRPVSVKVRALDRVAFGTEEVDLAGVEQLVERAQTRAMAEAVAWARGRVLDGRRDMRSAVDDVVEAIDRDGLGILHPGEIGELARFRSFELAAFLNRLRSLETLGPERGED